jgi:hypothetical protein
MPLTARIQVAPSVPVVPRSLDALAALQSDALLELYRGASTPSIRSVQGDLRGRMLAAQGARGLIFRLLRAFAAWRRFPWRGKSFTALSDSRGEGINRVFGDVKPSRWFRFETSIARSRAGDFDAFQLDYDNPGNPFFVRAIKDELREVSPGLYLGQAYVMWFGKPRLAIYFGLTSQ